VTVEFAVIRVPGAIRTADGMRVRRARARALTRGRGTGSDAGTPMPALDAGTNVIRGGSVGGGEEADQRHNEKYESKIVCHGLECFFKPLAPLIKQ